MNEGLKNMLNSETSRRMVTSLSNGHSDERFWKPLMENGACTFLALPNYKLYKVSAIRDFPEGCGQLASRINPETHVQTIECSLKKENLVVPSHMYRPPLANRKLANVQLVSIEAALEDIELTRAAKAVKCDSFNMSKPSSTVDEVVFSGGSKFLSSNGNISGCGACSEKVVTTRCFPQRRLSAVRDFPPLCGQNALHLSDSKGECLNGISSLENNSMVQQNMAADDKPS